MIFASNGGIFTSAIRIHFESFSFLGIGIVSDLFMSAIEKITSKTKQVHLPNSGDDGPDVIEYPVWNGTVANLTLMALGKYNLIVNKTIEI